MQNGDSIMKEDRSRTGSEAERGREVPLRRASVVNTEDEADTADPEDTPSLERLLLPSGRLPLGVQSFSVSYSRALLVGWVKQGSPCCAAASVAGAWNALCHRSRQHEAALTSERVLRAMRTVLEQQINAMTARFERLLGASILPVVEAVQTELAAESKHLGGQGPKAAVVKGPHLLRLVRTLTSRQREIPGHSPAFDCLWDLYEDGEGTTKLRVSTFGTEAGMGAESAERDGAHKQSGGNGAVASALVTDAISSPRADESSQAPSDLATAIADAIDESHFLPLGSADGCEGEHTRMDDAAEPGTFGNELSCGTPSSPATSVVEGVNPIGPNCEIPLEDAHKRSGGVEQGERCIAAVPVCWEEPGTDKGTARRGAGYDDGGNNAEEQDEEENEAHESDKEERKERGEDGPNVTAASRREKKPPRNGRKILRKAPSSATSCRVKNWNWKKDLLDLLKRIGGLQKVCASSPSTGAFGNLGVISTIRQLDSELIDPQNAQVTADLFMGKSTAAGSRPLPVPLSVRDNEEDKARQWAALREAFLAERQALIFHLSNHYAPIYALREWKSTDTPPAEACRESVGDQEGAPSTCTGPDTLVPPLAPARAAAALAPPADSSTDVSVTASNGGTATANGGPAGPVDSRVDNRRNSGGGWTRQVLTARRGQRPTACMNFEEVRDIMLGWDGYKVILARRGKGV